MNDLILYLNYFADSLHNHHLFPLHPPLLKAFIFVYSQSAITTATTAIIKLIKPFHNIQFILLFVVIVMEPQLEKLDLNNHHVSKIYATSLCKQVIITT